MNCVHYIIVVLTSDCFVETLLHPCVCVCVCCRGSGANLHCSEPLQRSDQENGKKLDPPWWFSFSALISFLAEISISQSDRFWYCSVSQQRCGKRLWTHRNGTDRKLPFPDSSFEVWLCNTSFLYQFPPSGHFTSFPSNLCHFLSKVMNYSFVFSIHDDNGCPVNLSPSVMHLFRSDLFNSRRRCTNCWRFMKGLGERRTSSTQPMNSSKRDTSKRCRPKMEQHKTDTSTWWEAAVVWKSHSKKQYTFGGLQYVCSWGIFMSAI